MTSAETTREQRTDDELGHQSWFLLLPWLLALPLIVLISITGFDGLYGQDAYAYYTYATGPLRESALSLQPPPPFFWPPGYPLLVTLLSLLLGVMPAAGQVVSLAAGALTPLLTALLAWEVWSRDRPPGAADRRWVPLLAGALVACMGQLWQSSAVVMSDTTGLAAATLGVWALVRYGRGASGRWLVLAGAAVAFAVLTRWAYALVAFPCGAYALYVLAQRPRRISLRHAAGAALVVGVVLSPVIYAALQPILTPGGQQAAFVGDLGVYRWNPLNALRREFMTADGLLRYRLPNGLYYLLAPAHQYYFTPLLALLLLPGLWTVVRRVGRAHLLLLLAWPAVIYAFHAGAAWQNFRFTLAYLPPLAILTAAGVVPFVNWLPGRWRWALPAVLGVGLLWMAYGGWSLTDSFIERKASNLQTVRWVEAQVEPDAQLFTFGLTLTFTHYSQLDTYDLFTLELEKMDELLRNGRPLYLFIDVANVETQWQDRAPMENYLWLQREAALYEIGQRRSFTLFRVVGEGP